MDDHRTISWSTEANVTTAELNALVIDYMVTEGYSETATRMVEESGCEMPRRSDTDEHMRARREIRNRINEGQMEEGVRLINDLAPTLLDNNQVLHFQLLQQHMIELLRHKKVEEALDFAQQHLSEKAEMLPAVTEELEKTMSLVAFVDMEGSPFGDLMHPAHRRRLASEVNAALLLVNHMPARPRIETLVKLIFWEQSQLDANNIPYARLTDVATATVEGGKQKNDVLRHMGVSQ